MDSRLSYLFGRRLSRLRQEDLPNLALAMTVYIRGTLPVSVGSINMRGTYGIKLESKDFQVAVLAEDWKKIEPYLRDDSFFPAKYPLPYTNQVEPVYDPGAIVQDPLYTRILDVLTGLFPEEYPTSPY